MTGFIIKNNPTAPLIAAPRRHRKQADPETGPVDRTTFGSDVQRPGLIGRVLRRVGVVGTDEVSDRKMASKLESIDDVLGVLDAPQGENFQGWVNLALKKPWHSLMALQASEERLPLTYGQRHSIHMLQNEARQAGPDRDREAILRGGITALSHLTEKEPDLRSVGRATRDLLLGAIEQAPATRKRFLEAGVGAIYNRTLADGDTSLKQILPLQGSIDDPLFLAQLLTLDPEFQRLPAGVSSKLVHQPASFRLSETEKTSLTQVLDENSIKLPPRLNVYTTPREEVLSSLALQRAHALNNLDRASATEWNDTLRKFSACDGETILDMFSKARECTQRREGMGALNKTQTRKVRALELAPTVLGAGLLGGLAVGTGVLGFTQGWRQAAELTVWLSGALMVLFPIVTAGCLFPASDMNKDIRAQARDILSSESKVIKSLKSHPDPTKARGTQISRDVLIEEAGRLVADQHDSKSLDSGLERIQILKRVNGKTAADMYSRAFLENNEKALDALEEVVNGLRAGT